MSARYTYMTNKYSLVFLVIKLSLLLDNNFLFSASLASTEALAKLLVWVGGGKWRWLVSSDLTNFQVR